MEKLFIPTKNRVENCSLIKMLHGNTDAIIVLEKEDFEQYNIAYPKFNYIILPESNMGISYVRNYIKNYTEEQGIDYYWMSDDDVTNFYIREGTKMIKSDISILNQAEQSIKLNKNFGISGLEYQQLAWCANKDFAKNSFCDVFVLINNNNTKGLRYRNYVEGKEDRDFAMQVIRSGHETMRTTLFAFSAPANGSNKGGLKEMFYDINGREEICSNRMVELWGEEICQKIVKPSGRVDVKIHWKKINSKQTSLF